MLTSRGLGTVLGDLAEAGYNAAWLVLGADDVGAPHRRKRIWILAEDTQRRDIFSHADKSQREGVDSVSERYAPEFSGAGNACGLWGFGDGWKIEPNVGRVAHGVAARVDRLKAIGNGQVPLVATTAFNILNQQLKINI